MSSHFPFQPSAFPMSIKTLLFFCWGHVVIAKVSVVFGYPYIVVEKSFVLSQDFLTKGSCSSCSCGVGVSAGSHKPRAFTQRFSFVLPFKALHLRNDTEVQVSFGIDVFRCSWRKCLVCQYPVMPLCPCTTAAASSPIPQGE